MIRSFTFIAITLVGILTGVACSSSNVEQKVTKEELVWKTQTKLVAWEQIGDCRRARTICEQQWGTDVYDDIKSRTNEDPCVPYAVLTDGSVLYRPDIPSRAFIVYTIVSKERDMQLTAKKAFGIGGDTISDLPECP